MLLSRVALTPHPRPLTPCGRGEENKKTKTRPTDFVREDSRE
jgi:hypothetical protein